MRGGGPAAAERMIAALNGADRALWATAFYTGMRRGESMALRREAVDVLHRGRPAVTAPERLSLRGKSTGQLRRGNANHAHRLAQRG